MDQNEWYIAYLKQRQEISLPQIQQELACSYSQAREKMEYFRQKNWVSRDYTGIQARVNTLYLAGMQGEEGGKEPRTELLGCGDVGLLTALEAEAQPEFSGRRVTRESHGDQLQRMLNLGLIHEVDGYFYPSVEPQVLAELKASLAEEVNDMMISSVAYPILVSALRKQVDVQPLLMLPMMPLTCRSYIQEGLARYAKGQTMPAQPIREYSLDSGDPLKYELLEAFIRNTDFSYKLQYVREAERNLQVVRSSRVCTVMIVELVRSAVEDIRRYRLEDLREIKKLLLHP